MRKKISVLLLAAGMVLAAAMPSQAIDFKVKGQWMIGFQHTNVGAAIDKNAHRGGTRDKFDAVQRFRIHLDAVASENLSGSVEFEIGAQRWGKAADGGALGADGKVVEVRFAYLDWIIPNTKIKTRMGLQTPMLPGVIDKYGFSPVFGKEMAAVTVSSPIIEGDVKMDATLFWARPYNDNYTGYDSNGKKRNAAYLDNTDAFGLVLPIKGDSWKVTPYFMYSMIGKNSMVEFDLKNGYDDGITAPRSGLFPYLGEGHYGTNLAKRTKSIDKAYGDAFWVGLPISVNVTDALKINLEGIYGSVNMGNLKNYTGFNDGRKDKTLELKRAGWYVGTKIEYKMDWGTPGLIAWYGSGDDSNPYNGSERLPQWNTPWATTSLGGGAVLYDDHSWKLLGHNPGGLAAVIGQIDNISFVEDLKHTLRFGYFHGTNSPKMVRKAGMKNWPAPADMGSAYAYMTTLDHAWEVNLANTYKIYENLTFGLEGAYVRLNQDKSIWKHAEDGRSGMGKDHYRVNCVFTYSF